MRYLRAVLLPSIVLFSCCAAPSPTFRLTDSVSDTRRGIIAAIPAGTAMERAGEIMRANGFDCQVMRDTAFLDREHIDFLYCDRSKFAGFMVSRRWQVALVEDRGRVKDVIVSTGLTGP